MPIHSEEIKEARAGDIVAASGLKETTTGDTLCDPKTIILERMEFPEPVISLRLSPKRKLIRKRWVLLCQAWLLKIRLLVQCLQ